MSIRQQATLSSVLGFSFHSIRNVTSPEDSGAGRKVYAGSAPASSVLIIPNDENVRDYIVDAPNKKRRALTSVHKAMFETLKRDPSTFSIKNGGVVIVARDIEIDEQKKTARLLKPSLINGAQTQGVLRDYLQSVQLESDPEKFQVSPKFEIIITDDEDLIAEISIARNSQNNVDPLSIAGKKGELEDLKASMLHANPEWDIRESETDGGETMIDTPKLLQVVMALIPPGIWPVDKDSDNPNKVFTYSMRAKCLKDFHKLYVEAKDSTAKGHDRAKAVYDFIIAFAPKAWQLYLTWKVHPVFLQSHIQQGVSRDGRKVVDVADGLLFPVLAALAVFVEKGPSGWNFVAPLLYEDKDLVEQLKLALKSPVIAGNPWNLGKSRDSYTLLFSWTNSQQKMARRYEAEFGARVQ